MILFSDGHLGLIRQQQLSHYGFSHAVDLHTVDYEKFALSIGMKYFRLRGDGSAILRRFLNHTGVSLLEVRLQDAPGMSRKRAKAMLKRSLKKILKQ